MVVKWMKISCLDDRKFVKKFCGQQQYKRCNVSFMDMWTCTWTEIWTVVAMHTCLRVCDDDCLCSADRARRTCSRWGKGGAEDGRELGGVEFGLGFPDADQEGNRGCGDEACCQGSQTAERYLQHLRNQLTHTQKYYEYIKYLRCMYSSHDCIPLISLDSCLTSLSSADLCQQSQTSSVEVQPKPESKRLQLCVLTLQVHWLFTSELL